MRFLGLLSALLLLPGCTALAVLLAIEEDPASTGADTGWGWGTTYGYTRQVDWDGDGWASDDDCNDGNAAVNPRADEVCNGVDDDCDGRVDEGVCGDTGDTGDTSDTSDTSDTADTGDTAADTGDTSDTRDTGADTGDTGADTADTGTRGGDTGDGGDTARDTGGDTAG